MKPPSPGDHSCSGVVTTAFACASSTNIPGGACTRQAPHPMQRSRWTRTVTRRLGRSEEHTSELQSQSNLVCRLLLEKKKDDVALGDCKTCAEEAGGAE